MDLFGYEITIQGQLLLVKLFSMVKEDLIS